jgi:nickel transport protein
MDSASETARANDEIDVENCKILHMTAMKSMLRRMAMAGGALLSASAIGWQGAWALSEAEIIEKLEEIPVFVIVDDEGRSLTANVTTEAETEVSVPVVFIHGFDAETFLSSAQAEEAAFAEGAQIALLSLGSLYEEASDQLDASASLVYVATPQEVAAASSIAQLGENETFSGVPLFAAVNLENGQYLLYADDTLPVFFSLADLQAQVGPYVEANPELQETIGVEVLTLEGLLRGMEANDPELDQLLELVQFVPSSTTINYLQGGSDG